MFSILQSRGTSLTVKTIFLNPAQSQRIRLHVKRMLSIRHVLKGPTSIDQPCIGRYTRITVMSAVRHGPTVTVPRYGLRESDTRFSPSGFFHESVSPGPLSIPLGPFWFFSKIRGDISESIFITGRNDTRNNLFSGVNDTGDKTVLPIPAWLDLKMKNKQKFYLQE